MAVFFLTDEGNKKYFISCREPLWPTIKNGVLLSKLKLLLILVLTSRKKRKKKKRVDIRFKKNISLVIENLYVQLSKTVYY